MRRIDDMKKRPNIVRAIITIIVVFLLIPGMVLSSPLSVEAQVLDQVVLQLRWEPQFQFAGYYAALWEGYYEEEGFSVEIRSGFSEDGLALQATEEVQAGRADFGVGAVDILLANDQGEPLTVVAAIFQRSAVAYYMRHDTRVRTPFDLVHLKTARRVDDLLDIELQAMLISEGIDPGLLPYTQKQGSFVLADLLGGDYDVVPVYLGSILKEAMDEEISLNVLRPIDYGIDFYGDSLFTSRKLTLENPELVERFRRATLKGWLYALEHPEAVAASMAETFYPERDRQQVLSYNLFQADEVRELTYFPIVQMGNLHTFRWEEMHRLLSQLHMLQQPFQADHFIFNYENIRSEQAEEQRQLLLVTSIIALLVLSGVLLVTMASRSTAGRMEALFKEAEEENKKKEALMIYQARMAAMGEMVANIAHQWRQPLNNLGLILANLEDAYWHGELDEKQLMNSMNKSKKLMDRMSGTIDDFMQFANPTQNSEPFDPHEEIEKIVDLLEEKCRLHRITVHIFSEQETQLYGHANQFSQAAFNLIANGVDVLGERTPDHRAIVIHIRPDQQWVKIMVTDTGGGIPDEIKNRIAEPYFSTKPQQQGTGLGLYMTKTIVENRLKGHLTWDNWDKGATMTMWIPGMTRGEEA